jgi:hypothetical protein
MSWEVKIVRPTTRKQLAAAYGVSIPTLMSWIKESELKCKPGHMLKPDFVMEFAQKWYEPDWSKLPSAIMVERKISNDIS